MKTFIVVMLFSFYILGLVTCSSNDEPVKPELTTIKTDAVSVKLPNQFDDGVPDGYQVLTIDSCEYIYAWFGGEFHGGGSLTHKGNCKFCEKRNELFLLKTKKRYETRN